MANPNDPIVIEQLKKRGIPMTLENAKQMGDLLGRVMNGQHDPSINMRESQQKIDSMFAPSKEENLPWLEQNIDSAMMMQENDEAKLQPMTNKQQSGTVSNLDNTSNPVDAAEEINEPTVDDETAEQLPNYPTHVASSQMTNQNDNNGWINTLLGAVGGGSAVYAANKMKGETPIQSPKVDPSISSKPTTPTVDDQLTKLIGQDAAPKQLPAPDKQLESPPKALPKPKYRVQANSRVADPTTASSDNKPRVNVTDEQPRYRSKGGDVKPVVTVKGKTIQIPEKMIQQLMRFVK